MIIIKVKKSSKGFRLVLDNANKKKFNHFYSQPSDAKRAWKAFEKQILEGKVKFIEE